MIDYTFERAWTERPKRNVDYNVATQGQVFWLPAKEDLSEPVKRAHGKGAVEEGIYNHPVVAISRPSDDKDTIHFHLITSLQGKRLDQLYAKANEFHASRRSWYLPVAPTPDHPDALSKKTKKRFPTLQLAGGAIFRWDSYVNIRHVYKIKMTDLKPYTNPECPNTDVYRFERESLIRMLAKCKTLTMYEPGLQHAEAGGGLVRSSSEPIQMLREKDQYAGGYARVANFPALVSAQTVSVEPCMSEDMTEEDFHMASTDGDRRAGRIPKIPPDEKRVVDLSVVQGVVVRPLEQLAGSIWSLAVIASKRTMVSTVDAVAIRQPLDRAWRDFKGFTAVMVASI